ncbi:3' terminal RNA ribose 2'-O-methyltransferase Hen1 [Lewinella sp. IMCC34191]|uniref:3' terminal RNA ribose 2'-O-methyltransferase Hen1 n=1 Tax=Lewinella sp. IMCC34191 TaxID=2259172 RepID=UPI000E23A281|nr:3' terminal RNA ribose 2'-O-methyltransferase Hen1 [Lewinella sp. IMCC34191]
MLLTISTTYQPATDLGFLLHKHPDRFQTINLSIGQAHAFYPESSPERTTVALLLDMDPIDMVRNGRSDGNQGFSLGQYVNDRPYVGSSFLSVALAKAFSTALNGTCHKRPELVDQPLPLKATLSVVSAPAGGEALLRKWFEPLGYTMDITPHALDATHPEWGMSSYYTVTMDGVVTLQALLAHLYVLIPALDRDKHYYVSEGEVAKLLAKGDGWLEQHPAREEITRRYLLGFRSLTKQVWSEWEGAEEAADVARKEKAAAPSLHDRRLQAVLSALLASGAESVLDLGCGEGKLLRLLLKERQFRRIEGMDVSYGELTKAMDRLHYEDLPPRQRERLKLWQGALTYRDERMHGFDAAAVVEVIEHLDENRLQAFERVVFGSARPATVVLTTPNADYNALFEKMEADTMRHTDHRFEWSREEFRAWTERITSEYAYQVSIEPIGPIDDTYGSPSQMAIFTHAD